MRWDVNETRWEWDETRKNWRWQQELKLDEMRWNEIQRDAFYSDEALMKQEYIWVTFKSDLSKTERDEDETW